MRLYLVAYVFATICAVIGFIVFLKECPPTTTAEAFTYVIWTQLQLLISAVFTLWIAPGIGRPVSGERGRDLRLVGAE